MANFFEILVEVLKADERFFTEDGVLLRNKVYESAMNMDVGLIELLLSNDETKQRFFADVSGTFVFDKVGFGWVVNNREFLPDSYTRFKNRIGLTDPRGDLISASGDVVLSFPYKDCVLEGGQSRDDQKRNEVFYNATLAPDEVDRLLYPKVLVGARRYSYSGSVDLAGNPLGGEDSVTCEAATEFLDSDNLIIKGNNLLAISSLLKRFEGKVKCIYIDPPYFFNETKEADSFKYNSNFSLSTWLVFMRNRLEIAKRLLTKGGTIWISIGEDGMHYLKVAADDIFGRDRFVGTIPRRTRNGKSDVPFNLSQDFDWLLCYTNVDYKNTPIGRCVERKYFETDDYPGQPWRLADATSQRTAAERPNSYFTMVNPKTGDQYPASEKRTWALTQDTFDYYYQKGAVVFPGDYDFLNISKPYSRKFKSEDDQSGKLSAVISDFQIQEFLQAVLGGAKNKDGNSEIDDMFGREEFGYAKPENLIKAIIEVATVEGDIVLDFHLGSGTTCAVAHKMERRYIGVEQMDYIETVSLERLKKVIEGEQGGVSKVVNWNGGGSFVYCELAKGNQHFVDEVMSAKTDADLVALLERVLATGFISSKVNPAEIAGAAADFEALSIADKKRFILELLDKNMLYANLCDIDDEEYGISDADKAFTRSFYGLEGK
jgi:adenine-specific DNA-methyltransferase